MGSPADRMLKLMYEWIREAMECSSNMKALADYLESLREDCNVVEFLGNTAAVTGSLVSICAVPFTAGTSLVVAGAVAGGLGAGVSLATKITEQFKSNSRLAKMEEIDKRCNKMADEIKDLYNEMKKQCPSSSAEQVDKHVVKEFLKATAKRSNQNIKDLDDVIEDLMDSGGVKKNLGFSIINEVIEVMSAFSLKLEGKELCVAAASAFTAIAAISGKEIGKAAAVKGMARLLGGVVGLGISFYEARQNWIKAIEKNNETDTSRSLRDMASEIDGSTKNLNGKLSQIQTIVSEEVSQPRLGGELNMALLNSRSANKFISPPANTLSNLIEANRLDVLLLTETWLPFDNLRRGEFRTILPETNTAISNPRFFRRAGGVAIITSLNATPVVFNFPETFEYAAASVRRSERDAPTLILNIYRPPESNHAQFFEELRTLLCEAFLSFRRVLIAGDFNIWMDRPDLNEPRGFQSLLDDFGLRQHVSGPTHTAGHTLDLVIARPDVQITNVSAQPNYFSDHSTVFFRVKVTRREKADDDVNDIIAVLGNMHVFKKK